MKRIFPQGGHNTDTPLPKRLPPPHRPSRPNFNGRDALDPRPSSTLYTRPSSSKFLSHRPEHRLFSTASSSEASQQSHYFVGCAESDSESESGDESEEIRHSSIRSSSGSSSLFRKSPSSQGWAGSTITRTPSPPESSHACNLKTALFGYALSKTTPILTATSECTIEPRIRLSAAESFQQLMLWGDWWRKS